MSTNRHENSQSRAVDYTLDKILEALMRNNDTRAVMNKADLFLTELIVTCRQVQAHLRDRRP